MPDLMKGKNGNGHDKFIHVDTMVEGLTGIDYPHHEIHEGNHYTVTWYVANLGAATTPNDTMSVAFTTANTTKWAHMLVTATSAAGTRMRFIEGKTGGGGAGTGDIVCYNNNRNSTNTSGLISHHATPATGYVTYDSDLFTGGASLIDIVLGTTGQGNAVVGGESRGDNEYILAQNTLYQVSLYNTGAVAGSISISWYEATSKE